MGVVYSVLCKACKHEFEQVVGPLMSGPTLACQECGRHPDQPEFAPSESPEMSNDDLAYLLISGRWPAKGRQFTPRELTSLRLLVRAQGCICGGRIFEECDEFNIKYRCEICRSTDLIRTKCGFAD